MLCEIALLTLQAFSRMIWCAGLKRKLLSLKLNVVPPSPDRAMAGTAPGNRIGTNLIRVAGTVTRIQTDLPLLLRSQKFQHGAPLAEIVTGAGVEAPPLEFATPKLSRETIITRGSLAKKKDNVFA